MRQNLGLSYFVHTPILFRKIHTLTCKIKTSTINYHINIKIKYQNYYPIPITHPKVEQEKKNCELRCLINLNLNVIIFK